LDIALASYPGSRIVRVWIIIPLPFTTTIQNVSSTTATTTTTGRTLFSTYLLPTTTIHQRGATPYHDHNLIAAGQYHAPSATRE